MNFLHQIAAKYQSCVAKAPFLTNGTMGFMIAGTGDLVCQRYFEYPRLLERLRKKKGDSSSISFEWDKKRSFQMGFIRAAVITPFVLFWYPFITALSPGRSFFSILGRIVLDQSAGGPLVIGLVFSTNAFLNNQLSSVRQQIIDQFYITWVSGLKYWPFVHIITFGVLPPIYQPLFAHVASVYWNAILSFYSNQPDNPEQE
jgi:hypothetical protein